MTHAGYFEGIGGFSLAAEMLGIDTVYTCEIDDFCNNWLQYRLPNAIHERDIKNATGHYADIFTGGFPCQDISIANPHGKGLDGDRSGLWWEFYRLICIHRPRYVVLENSPMLLHKGLRDILTAFAKIGYDAEWQVISKQSLGYADERKRLFVIAYACKIGRQNNSRIFTRINYEMCKQKIITGEQFWAETIRISNTLSVRKAHALAISDDSGLSKGLVKAEIEAYGNAVCPQVASMVFMLIKTFDKVILNK